MNTENSLKTFYIIDGSAYIFRAFYATGQSGFKSREGIPTGAVFGFKNMLYSLLETYKPDYIAVVFDAGSRTTRHDYYPQYKANRSDAPDELKPQFSLIQELVKAMNLCMISAEGIEADDIIGTLATQFKNRFNVRIVSGDKDLTQLVDAKVSMLDTMKNRLYDRDSVKEKFGVYPEQITQYLALTGDTSDNIPGAMGVGPKTAVQLLEEYGSLDGLKQNLSSISGKKGENLRQSWDNVEISLRLATIDINIPLNDIDPSLSNPEAYSLQRPNLDALNGLYRRLNFKIHSPSDKIYLLPFSENDIGITPEQPSALNRKAYKTLTSEQDIQILTEAIAKAGVFCIDLETDGLDKLTVNIVGIAVACNGHPACYIPCAHQATESQLTIGVIIRLLQPVFQNAGLHMVCHHLKFDRHILEQHGAAINCICEDTMLMSYLLDAEGGGHGLDSLANRHLGHTMISYESLTGKGRQQVTFDRVPIDKATEYAAEDADATLKLYELFAVRIQKEKIAELYRDIEIPLSHILDKMETAGVLINIEHFNGLKARWTKDMEELEQKIYVLAGEPFNLNSPKQLADILFTRMGIKEHIKKNKTGISTDASVLEKLAPKYEIASLILQYRTLTKLVNTYVDALSHLIHPQTGRIHTSFNQTVAATGRLSSSNPGLQNIPIKGTEGKLIREGFVSADGYIFLSADYSQIELRVLAHMAEDSTLTRAFREDKDIHSETAKAIFGLHTDEVTPDYRRLAKAINFGIIYGMGAFRLAQDTGISNAEAKQFIDRYFSQFSSIQNYISETIKYARFHGFVKTLFGRKRQMTGINDRNINIQKGWERVAVNTTIQGTAADIIKKAMIDIDRVLTGGRFRSRMLLQVHDELVFEVAEDELETVKTLITDKMSGAVSLNVPLKVSCGYGKNWDEAHG